MRKSGEEIEENEREQQKHHTPYNKVGIALQRLLIHSLFFMPSLLQFIFFCSLHLAVVLFESVEFSTRKAGRQAGSIWGSDKRQKEKRECCIN